MFPKINLLFGMGTIQKGILGGFSGKVGSVVGGSWKGIDYMRSKAKGALSLLPKNKKNSRLSLASSPGFSNLWPTCWPSALRAMDCLGPDRRK